MTSLTIIIPAYNAGPYIARAVESALDQGPHVEKVVVVNDGSTDDTAEKVKPHLNQIEYIEQENKGVAEARNRGALAADSEWILFLDADDCLFPEATAKALLNVHSKDGVIFGNVLDMTPGKKKKRGAHYQEGAPPAGALASFWKAFIITPGSALVRRELHMEIGGFLPFQPVEDRLYWMQAGMLGRFRRVEVDMVKKRDVAFSASSDRAKGLRSGLRAQLAFLEWCRVRKLSLQGFEQDPKALCEYSLQKARRMNCWEGVDLLLEEAEHLEIHSPSLRQIRQCRALLPYWDGLKRSLSWKRSKEG